MCCLTRPSVFSTRASQKHQTAQPAPHDPSHPKPAKRTPSTLAQASAFRGTQTRREIRETGLSCCCCCCRLPAQHRQVMAEKSDSTQRLTHSDPNFLLWLRAPLSPAVSTLKRSLPTVPRSLLPTKVSPRTASVTLSLSRRSSLTVCATSPARAGCARPRRSRAGGRHPRTRSPTA